MKIQRLLVTLTVVNLALLVFLLAQMRPVEASNDSGILRGRALQIVDDLGKVRASIQVYPADDKLRLPDGTVGYPETVLLRLIDQNGRPSVKLDASTRGAGILLGGEADPTYAQLGARRGESRLLLKNREGREQVISSPAAAAGFPPSRE
jgi:hypothetical protein